MRWYLFRSARRRAEDGDGKAEVRRWRYSPGKLHRSALQPARQSHVVRQRQEGRYTRQQLYKIISSVPSRYGRHGAPILASNQPYVVLAFPFKSLNPLVQLNVQVGSINSLRSRYITELLQSVAPTANARCTFVWQHPEMCYKCKRIISQTL